MLPVGLAFYLFGISQLSSMFSGLSGKSVSNKINKWTKSDFTKAFAGFAVTSLFQSSSAVAAILISMTSVGLISVLSSVSYLIGSNVGLMVTAWVVAVKITKAGLFMFAAGIITKLVVKNKTVKNISFFVAGLGLIFFGLETMSSSVAFIREHETILSFFTSFDAATSILAMVILTFSGILFTAVIQSSGATVAMVVGLVLVGAISVHSGAAIVLGSNFGTIIAVYLASIGTSAEGKRTAFLQVLIKIVELASGLLLFYPTVWLAVKVTSLYSLNAGFAVAFYMTFLKILLGIIVFPIRKKLADIAEKLLKKRFRLITETVELFPVATQDTPEKIKENFAPTVELCIKYIVDMLGYSYIGIRKPALRSIYQKVIQYEKIIDETQQEIASLISETKNPLSDVLWLYLKTADELESMSDHAKSIAKYGIRLDEIKHKLSDDQKRILLKCYLLVFKQFYEICVKKNYDPALVKKSEQIEREIRVEKRKFYSLLCTESDHNYEKRLILVDILSEYSKFNHSVKRILQVNLDMIEGRGIFLWEKRCKD